MCILKGIRPIVRYWVDRQRCCAATVGQSPASCSLPPPPGLERAASRAQYRSISVQLGAQSGDAGGAVRGGAVRDRRGDAALW